MDIPASLPTRWVRGAYEVDTEPSRLDLDMVHRYLHHESYWAAGVPREVLDRAVANSLNFGLYTAGDQVGFARVVTDRAVFAYLADVFVLPAHQGAGAGSFLLATIVAHPWVQGLRRFSLATRDAHQFYERFGFEVHPEPRNVLEIRHTCAELYGEPGS